MNRPWAEREFDERVDAAIHLTGIDAVRPFLTTDAVLALVPLCASESPGAASGLERLRTARDRVRAHDARYIARHEAHSARLRADSVED